MLIYIIFQFQWGLNYHRIPLKNKLLIEHNYSTKSLINITGTFCANVINGISSSSIIFIC